MKAAYLTEQVCEALKENNNDREKLDRAQLMKLLEIVRFYNSKRNL